MRPSLSGKMTTLLLFSCLAAAGLVLPVAAHLPHWIEFELVLGIWWVVWWIVLGWMLFHRMDVDDDASMPKGGWLRERLPKAGLDGCLSVVDAPMGCSDAAGCLGGDGCGVAVLAAGFVVMAVIGIWLVLEFLVPVIAFGLYLAVRGMLRQAAKWHERCEGSPELSLFWAAVWTTVYLAPIGLAIWGIQALVAHRG